MIQKVTKESEKKFIRITGRVTDENKNALPGVTDSVKGMTIGTATDAIGKYMLRLPEMENLSLLFSFVGMETKEVKYTGQDTINVMLKETVNEMDEVTVVSTGYQTVNRKDMVGSYTTVKAEDIMMPAYANIDQMLQGQVPGMMVLSSSARAGASPKIQIRGTSTVLGNSDPIWVVDGIIQDDPISINASSNWAQDMEEIIGNQVSWLNPNDIE
ncbi:MAG: carboxypeptidase-like regulatory domain-containing protein, partial [Butyricimonas faecihominis]